MMYFIVWLLLLLLLLYQPNVSCWKTNETWTSDSDNHQCIPCHIVRIDVSMEEVGPTRMQQNPIKCITKHPLRSYRLSYDIDLPETFLQEHQHVIDGGDAFVCVNDAYIDEYTNRIVMRTMEKEQNEQKTDSMYTVSSYKAIQQRHHRSLQVDQQNYQEFHLLVVRIIDANGVEPNESSDSINGAIFGTGSNPENISASASVVQHLSAVTHGKVLLVPSEGIVTISSNGIIDVPISLPVNGSGFFRELLPEILNATELVVGPMDDAADVYIFCLPDGASLVGRTGWTGFSVDFEPYSFFQKSYCTKISSVIHELGHSIFGFAHSSKNGEEYGDISCYMGFIDDRVAYPLKAFNAHKHWLSGWFDDKAEIVNRTTLPRDGNERRLVSFVDYDDESLLETDVVLITVDDLYIQYDIPKGYNIHSLSRGNILITQANDTMSRSVAVANLSIGQSFTYQKLSVTEDVSSEIVIEVCKTGSTNDTIDYSIISIFLNDGEQRSTCIRTENVTLSSDSPTPMLESAVPSSVYSFVPSDVPTNYPPMPNRNSEPSARPILTPTNAITDIPSPLRTTMGPSDVDIATSGPAVNGNTSASETSSGMLRFTKAMKLSTCCLVAQAILNYYW